MATIVGIQIRILFFGEVPPVNSSMVKRETLLLIQRIGEGISVSRKIEFRNHSRINDFGLAKDIVGPRDVGVSS
jgi:hypothetical protein